jgi:hypothetical protein
MREIEGKNCRQNAVADENPKPEPKGSHRDWNFVKAWLSREIKAAPCKNSCQFFCRFPAFNSRRL